MFTNQRLLGVLLILFVMGGLSYFAFNKFKQDVSNVTASPSPSAASLEFLFNQPRPNSPNQAAQQDLQLQIKPASASSSPSNPSPLPLEKNKRLSGFPGVLTDESLQNKKVLIQTSKGIIQIQIFPQTKLASSNFLILAAAGFYNNLTFHRVEDWLIQGGDPNGDGSGGPGYRFDDEPVTKSYVRGTLAMANAGPNTNGSQFFILKKDYPLQPLYTIFGQVISGMEVVDKITIGDVMQKVVVQNLQ